MVHVTHVGTKMACDEELSNLQLKEAQKIEGEIHIFVDVIQRFDSTLRLYFHVFAV